MALYSLALIIVLLAGAPYWLVRMMTSGRYRAGLLGRLGRVPAELRGAVTGKQVVWLHAVSVGEVLAATRLAAELEARLNSGSGLELSLDLELKAPWLIVVSTTTATGQALARERFGAPRVFYYPLDLGWAVRAYLRALNPRLLILMESELWPRMLAECNRARIPIAVANARVSDRSFARGMRVRPLWSRLLRRVTLFLAQSEEDGRRLIAMGAHPASVHPTGNLKYDSIVRESSIVRAIGSAVSGRTVVVAGSTTDGEEKLILSDWHQVISQDPKTLLILAPRHPERFREVANCISEQKLRFTEVSILKLEAGDRLDDVQVLLLDTVGDLAATYSLADVAFVGGSLLKRGGHNPLEAARFGVPVIMGSSFENFRDIVGRMQKTDGIRIMQHSDELAPALLELLMNREKAKAIGEQGRRVFEDQQGATKRTIEALLNLVKP